MRSWFLLIFIMIGGIGVIGACKPSPSPSMTPSSTTSITTRLPSSSSSPTPSLQSIPNHAKKKLVSLIVDRSLSMEDYCSGNMREILWNIIKVFPFLSNQTAQQHPLFFSFQIFPAGNMTNTIITKPISASDFVLPKQFPEIIRTTLNEYARAITDANDMSGIFDEQEIILFTDGSFREETEKEEIADAISRTKPKQGTKIYLVICNSKNKFDAKWWGDRVNQIYDISNFEEWLPAFVEKIVGPPLSNHLQISDWFTSTNVISLPNILGDSERVEVNLLLIKSSQGQPKYRSFPGGDYFLEKNIYWDNLYTTTISLRPIDDCDPFRAEIRLSEQNSGIYIVKFKRPQPSLIITTPLISVNNNPITISIQLANIPSNQWASCYRIEFNLVEGKVEGNREFDRSLYRFYNWKPDDIDQPRLVSGTISLIDRQERTLKMDNVRAEVKFNPIVEPSGIRPVPGSTPQQGRLTYMVQYHPISDPKFFLCTSKSKDEILKINKQRNRGKDPSNYDLLCPIPTLTISAISSPYCYSISISAQDEQLSAQSPAIVYRSKMGRYKTEYSLKMYRFMQDPEDCGYTTVIFNFEGQDTISVTWICPLENQGSCKEMR